MKLRITRTFVGALAIYTAGGLFWAFLPFFVGLQISTGGLTQAEAGSMGSAYLVGFSIASLSALWWIARFNWRALIPVGAAGVVGALVVLAGSDSYLLSVASVLIVGVIMGGLWTIAYRIFSASPDPERSFATGIVVSYTILAAISFTIGRWIVPEYGLSGSAYFLSGIIVLLAASAFLVPAGLASEGDSTAGTNFSRAPANVVFALLGLLTTSLVFAAVWAFAERLGVASGFDSTQISPIVASNLLGSAAGSVLAGMLGTRFGRKRTLLIGLSVMTLSVLCLLWADSYWIYGVAVVGLGFTVGFVLPYQMGTVAALDKDGKFVVLIGAAQGVGSALGPVLAGIGFGLGGITALVSIAVTAMVVSAVLFAVIKVRETT
jgi:MFS family permease